METNEILTERLEIRAFREGDRAGFAALIRDKMASPFAAYDEQYPVDEQGLRGLFECFLRTDEFFAVSEIASRRLIGYVALNAVEGDTRNLGYCLHSAFQGKGYAAEAARAMIAYAKKRGVRMLVSGTALENAPSVRLLEKLGFSETDRSVGSFVCGDDGRPILFSGIRYELPLERSCGGNTV